MWGSTESASVDQFSSGGTKKMSSEIAAVASFTTVVATRMSLFECRFRTPPRTSRISEWATSGIERR
jgi:hypothetical protein